MAEPLSPFKANVMKTCISILVALWMVTYPGFSFADLKERILTRPFLSHSGPRPAHKPRVSCTLSLSSYQFWIDRMPGLGNEERRGHFGAVFSLVNTSGSDIPLELISHCGENKPVQFILRNAENEILWQYVVIDPRMACPDYLESRVLPDNGRFHHRAAIPLIIDGEFLEPGEYSLEAFVDGYPRYGAYAPFRVDYAY